jgi:hypothetical protein
MEVSAQAMQFSISRIGNQMGSPMGHKFILICMLGFTGALMASCIGSL